MRNVSLACDFLSEFKFYLKFDSKHDEFGLCDFDFMHLFHLSNFMRVCDNKHFQLREDYINVLQDVRKYLRNVDITQFSQNRD